MEAVSAAASIVTLVALAKEISTLATDLLRGIHSGPKELARVHNQTCLVVLGLHCLEKIAIDTGWRDLLEPTEIWVLRQTLTVAKHNMSAIREDCGMLCGKPSGLKWRLAWTLFERRKVEEYLLHLQQTESSLGVVLQFINMKASFKAYSETEKQFNKIKNAIQDLHTEQQLQKRASISRADHSNLMPQSNEPLTPSRYINTNRLSEFWKWLLACEFFVLITTNGSHKNYGCYARVSLPTLVGGMAIILSLSVRRHGSTWRNLVVLGGRLTIVNYVSEQSAIVVACIEGDLIAVRNMFRENKAAPSDVSDREKSLLWYATRSGSTELVEYLINEGTPVTSGVLLAAAYWRRPEIARLCLLNGADVEAVGDDGYTAAFFLFGSSRKCEPQTEFLEILACNSFQNFDAQDACGWTALHRAAAFGTREDVKALLALKASVDVRTYNLEWTPLFCAVCFGNLETIQELWGWYENPSQVKDLRHWNLLHVAAGAGKLNPVPFLLENNVDLCSLSRATSRFVPPLLVGRQVTPSLVARSCGGHAYGKWCEVLNSKGYGSDISYVDIDWDGEEEAGRYGGCECCESWGF